MPSWAAPSPGWPGPRPWSWTARPAWSGWAWPRRWPPGSAPPWSAWTSCPPPGAAARWPAWSGPHADGPPDAPGTAGTRPRRRAHHPRTAYPPAGRGAHRDRQGQVHRRVRAGLAGLEPGLADRRVPVREVGQVAGRGGERAPHAGRQRPGRHGGLAQDGGGLVLDPAPPGGPRRPGRRGLGPDHPGPGRADLPLLRTGRVHLPDQVGLGRRAGSDLGAAGSPGPPARGHHRPRRPSRPGRVRRPGHRHDQGEAPDGSRSEGPEGHRMVAVPRLVIAAPSSGSGKTTVACGLMAALRATGLVVSGHKVGPDYIDPGYHSLATGRPARNLDPALCGARRIAPLFLHAARGADVAVIEGVMGLFDGATAPTGEGAGDPGFSSTAHVAGLLGAPVVLVIDASAAGRSVAAVATGFDRFDPGTTVAGVILNQVGSDRHEQLLRDALAAAGFPVFGAIRRSDEVSAPSRHLGLIPVAERSADATEATARLGALIAASCDLPA